MFGLGGIEMLVIGVAALIFIGPKELPAVMNRVGKVVGQIRRMGNEFQREINKTTGLDEVRNLRDSITGPLKKTSDEIRKDFNAMTPSGPKPSGIIKPADPKSESVVDEIKAAAGITPPKTADQIAAEAGFKPTRPAAVKAASTPKSVATKPAAGKTAANKPAKVPAKKAPAKAAAAPTSPVVTTDLPSLEAVPSPAEAQPIAKPARKPRTPKVVEKLDVPVLPTEPADSPATKTPRARAPRKTAAKAGEQ